MAAKWLKDTVFYEIYPQSFKDTNPVFQGYKQ